MQQKFSNVAGFLVIAKSEGGTYGERPCMLYGRSCDQNVQLFMNGNLIEKVEKYKSLGIVFNTVKNINGNIFRYNTDHLNNKARGAIFGIQKKTQIHRPSPD